MLLAVFRPKAMLERGEVVAGQRESTVVAAVGRHGTSSGQKFPLPTQVFAGKIQIPALPDFNAGICVYETGIFIQSFAINIQEMFVRRYQLVGD